MCPNVHPQNAEQLVVHLRVRLRVLECTVSKFLDNFSPPTSDQLAVLTVPTLLRHIIDATWPLTDSRNG